MISRDGHRLWERKARRWLLVRSSIVVPVVKGRIADSKRIMIELKAKVEGIWRRGIQEGIIIGDRGTQSALDGEPPSCMAAIRVMHRSNDDSSTLRYLLLA